MSRSLRRACARLIRDLELPTPFDLTRFCHDLGVRRGRPLTLMEVDLPTALPCGMVAALDDRDIIFITAGLTGPHRDVVGLHEIGHLIAGHLADPLADPDAGRFVFKHLDPRLVRSINGRSNYSTPEEQQAEMIATMLFARIARFTAETQWSIAGGAGGVVDRISRSLGDGSSPGGP
ncbi:hypothetical protein [Streptacidiphilus sp. EB129]|uniref:hypothetical protein n=1 Tax=Streptacidiphilus sp. EB129 TaxID=3156262 RepID=UPI0035134C48